MWIGRRYLLQLCVDVSLVFNSPHSPPAGLGDVSWVRIKAGFGPRLTLHLSPSSAMKTINAYSKLFVFVYAFFSSLSLLLPSRASPMWDDSSLQAGSSESRRNRLRRTSFDGPSPPSTLKSNRWVSPSEACYSSVTADGSKSNKSKSKTKSTGKVSASARNRNAREGGTGVGAASPRGLPVSSEMMMPSDVMSPDVMTSDMTSSDMMSDQGSPVDPRQVTVGTSRVGDETHSVVPHRHLLYDCCVPFPFAVVFA